MFSNRTQWDARPNRLALAVERARRDGRVLIDLTETNPTRAGLRCPPDILALLSQPAAARYEPAPLGCMEAREAVAADYARRGWMVPAQRIVLTASSSEAYAFLFKVLCDPGDAVLIPHPSYPLFEYLAGIEGVRTLTYPLEYERRWCVGLEALTEALRREPRARAIVAVSPNNPTGSVLSQPEWEQLHRIAQEHDLALIGDEVFADFAWAPRRPAPPSFAQPGPALSFALGGLSKSCGLPQLKLGWIAVSGPEPACAEALARLEIVADTFLSVSTPIQVAAPQILARQAELAAPILERIRTNRSEIERQIAQSSPFTLLAGDGGWTSVLRAPATMTEDERALRLLEERNVLVHPGYFFDFAHEAYLVVSLLPPPDLFAEGIARVLDNET